MKTKYFAGKRILYISTISFHYDKAVIEKLTEFGALVDTFELYPRSFYFKTIRKLNLSTTKKYYKHFYSNLLLMKGYDYVMVRHGHLLYDDLLSGLRKNNPNAWFVNFHWDSIKPDYDYSHVIKYFDNVFSFDYKDCQTYKQIKYLPLFFLDEYSAYRQTPTDKSKDIDLLFIGSWRNTERYKLIKKTELFCHQFNLIFFHYLHFSFKEQFDLIKKGILAKNARSTLLTHKEILHYFSKSSCIIDFPSSFQTGLTIRTFEALGAGKKLITTNSHIKDEPFYNPEFVNIVDPVELKLDIDFIKKTPNGSLSEKMEKYSINNYLISLLQK